MQRTGLVKMFVGIIIFVSCTVLLYTAILSKGINLQIVLSKKGVALYNFQLGDDEEDPTTPNPNTLTLDDVYITVKTSKRNRKSRIPVILKTWYQLAKEQTWFFTDTDDKEFQNLTHGHAINTKCGPTHSRMDLNCKMVVEINTYMTTNKTWFCHFDDDNYVNVPKLLDLLKKYDAQGEWYLGKLSLKNGINPTVKEEKKKVRFWFGTGGAGICISRPLMIKMKPFTIDNKFIAIGESLSRGDDVVVGYIIEHLLNTSLTEVKQFHSHYENHKRFKLETIQEQISLSYTSKNTVEVEGFDKKSDPTRFMSVHCILFPKVDFCSKMKRARNPKTVDEAGKSVP